MGGYCLLGDLSSNTSRQAASPEQRERTRGFLTPYPRGGQPPALVEIKNSLYYTSHSTPSSTHLFDRFPRSFCMASLLFAITSSSAVVPPHAYSFLLSSPLRFPLIIFRRSGGASFARTDLIWGRLYLMERILLKFRLHAKPLKYRRPPSSSSFDPLRTTRLPCRPFGPHYGGLGHRLFVLSLCQQFSSNLCWTK